MIRHIVLLKFKESVTEADKQSIYHELDALKGHVEGIDQAEFEQIAAKAKAECPVSKVLNAEITLETTFG